MKEEFLNEEKYQKTNKKIIRLSLIILVVGLLIGSIFITIGIVSVNNEKRKNDEEYKESLRKIDELDKEIEELDIKIKEKGYECDSISFGSTWFADRNKCLEEKLDLNSELAMLELERSKLANKDYNSNSTTKYVIYYIIGGFVIVLSLFASGTIYMISKRREIEAYTVQQSMPIKQEVIDKMAPTIGDAAGTISKSIAKGIKDGLDDKE